MDDSSLEDFRGQVILLAICLMLAETFVGKYALT